jgi:O-antigen biosynthesis protein
MSVSLSPLVGGPADVPVARPYVSDMARQSTVDCERPSVRCKFLSTGEGTFYACGVTYGPFRPGPDGCAYRTPDVVRRDFAAMAANNINSVRTYTVPPAWLLDTAYEQGLRVLAGVGLAGEQHVAFLDDHPLARQVRNRCAADVRACAGHPALLGYVIGNEIPAPIVRWHGRRRVERFLADLYDLAKGQDPDGLVTYVNYPTTEYLQLPFLDFHAYNVYLESPERLAAYLGRLQNLAGDKPLVMAEIGLDGLRHGVRAQARSIEWQIRTAFGAGCAGAFVFAWTDEWHTGGLDVVDWKFGLTDAARRSKPALARARRAFAQVPFPEGPNWPRISVVVCTHNGGRTIAECLEGVSRLAYPDYEVIVVDDGSSDETADIVKKYDVRLIRTANHGLSSARNTGMRAASGEIIAYLDDDAWPDPHWLSYLAHTFRTTDHAGVGGPNLVPPDDGPVAQCVGNAPGGPTHVLLSDRTAEHLPGCNIAFRRERLLAVGGFDVQFRIAGDDVDVCWRLQEQGHTLGFHPAAVVWHHRRNSAKAYLKQQLNYGRAEALLEAKWPDKYNAVGHITWRGRLYGGVYGCGGIGLWPSRVYHGVWSSQAFQSLYTPGATLGALPLTPEWYLLVVTLAGMGMLGRLWPPLSAGLPLSALVLGVSVAQAVRAAARASFARPGVAPGRRRRLMLRGLVAALHLVQPVVRLWGRLAYGLTPWRRHGRLPWGHLWQLPLPRLHTAWSETWEASEHRLEAVELALRERGVPVRRGGEFDEWDLEVRGGLLAGARTRMAIEQYPGGRQFVRFRSWPKFSAPTVVAVLLVALLALGAAVGHAPLAAAVLGAAAILAAVRTAGDGAAAITCLAEALERYRDAIQGARRPREAALVRERRVEVRESRGNALLADLSDVLELPAGPS